MIKFIKPNLQENHGMLKECVSKSTMSGQYKESKYDDAHQELNSKLSSLSKKIHNCIHRRDESVLRQFLLGKFEFSLIVKLTNIQADMYEVSQATQSKFIRYLLKPLKSIFSALHKEPV